MKKLFILMAAAIFAAGCVDGDIYNTRSESYNLVALAEDWVITETANEVFYDVEFIMPEITQEVCSGRGTVEVYLIEDGFNIAMPDTRWFDDEAFIYSQTISYYFTPGALHFTLAYSDFNYDYVGQLQAGDRRFRVIITEPY